MSKRVSRVLLNLPRDITPVNLEELRRVKQALVELESKADNLRCHQPGLPIALSHRPNLLHAAGLRRTACCAESLAQEACELQNMRSFHLQVLPCCVWA